MTRAAKIGALVALALGILIVTVMSLGERQRFWERKVPYEIHFARTNGLQEGAAVSLTGVTIGSVEDMRFPPDPHADYIQVWVSVVADVANRIRQDSKAMIRTYGLLGDRYIELTAGTPGSPPIPPGGLLTSIDPVDYEAVFGQGGDIVTNIVEVSASLKTLLQAIERGEGLLGALVRNQSLGEATLTDLQRTMANVQGTTHALEQILVRVERGEGLLGRFTRDSKENQALLARVDRATRELEKFAQRLGRSEGLLGRLTEDDAYAQRVLGNLDRTLADLAAVAAKLNHGEGTLPKLLNDPALYNDARSLMARARRSWLLRLMGGGGSSGEPTPPTPDPGAEPR